MLIDRLIPGFEPAIRQAFMSDTPIHVDTMVEVLIQVADYSMLLGFIVPILLINVYWIGRDVVAFVRRELANRRKHAD